MTAAFKKILVLLPVVLLGCIYLYDHTELYRRVSGKRLLLLGLTFCILYGWIFIEVMVRRQKNFFQITAQGSFYVYIFMVLTLTGYFIFFREISAGGWYDRMMFRIDHKDRVNFELFKIFRIYKMSNTQIVGNFAMLFPLGIYLPLLYKWSANFVSVVLVSMLISGCIEFLQLVTSHRSADVDDVLLNTVGAAAGFIVFAIVKAILRKPSVAPPSKSGAIAS